MRVYAPNGTPLWWKEVGEYEIVVMVEVPLSKMDVMLKNGWFLCGSWNQNKWAHG